MDSLAEKHDAIIESQYAYMTRKHAHNDPSTHSCGIWYLGSHGDCHSVSQDIYTLQHVDSGLLAKLEVVGSIEPGLCGASS